MPRPYSLQHALLIAVALLLQGGCSADDRMIEECNENKVFSLKDPLQVHAFSGDGKNCRYHYSREFLLLPPSRIDDIALLTFHDINVPSPGRLDVYDVVTLNGTRMELLRFSESTIPKRPITNTPGAGMLVVLWSWGNTNATWPSFNAEFRLTRNATFQCPYPFLTTSADVDTLAFTIEADNSCSMQIATLIPGKKLHLELNITGGGIDLYRTIRVYDRKFRGGNRILSRHVDENDRTDTFSEGVHTINVHRDAVTVRARNLPGQTMFATIKYRQVDDGCECFPVNISVSPDRPAHLTAPLNSSGFICRHLECETTVALADGLLAAGYSLQLRHNSPWRASLRGLSLLDGPAALLKTLDERWFNKFYSPPSTGKLRIALDTVRHYTEHFNVTIAAVKLGEHCKCPDVDMRAMVVNVTIPTGCPFIDCSWELRTPEGWFDESRIHRAFAYGDEPGYCTEPDSCYSDHIHRSSVERVLYLDRWMERFYWHRACVEGRTNDEDDKKCTAEATITLSKESPTTLKPDEVEN